MYVSVKEPTEGELQFRERRISVEGYTSLDDFRRDATHGQLLLVLVQALERGGCDRQQVGWTACIISSDDSQTLVVRASLDLLAAGGHFGTPCVLWAACAQIILWCLSLWVRADAIQREAVRASWLCVLVPLLGVPSLGQAGVGTDDDHVEVGGLQHSLSVALDDAEAGTLDGDAGERLPRRQATGQGCCEDRRDTHTIREVGGDLNVDGNDVAHLRLLGLVTACLTDKTSGIGC